MRGRGNRIVLRAAAALALLLPFAAAAPAAADESVVAVLRFDNYLGDDTIPAKNPGPLLTPSQCRTTTHTAGPNEVAVVQVSGTVSPSTPTDGNVNLVVTRSLPLQAFVSVNAFPQSESVSDGTAGLSSFARVPLTEGFTYQFGAGFAADHQLQVSTFSCQGVVIFYRLDP